MAASGGIIGLTIVDMEGRMDIVGDIAEVGVVEGIVEAVEDAVEAAEGSCVRRNPLIP